MAMIDLLNKGLLLGAFALAVGCNAESGNDTDDTDDTDDTQDTDTDTNTGPNYDEIYAFYMGSAFGIDPDAGDAGQLIAYNSTYQGQGYTVNPSFYLYFMNEFDEDICSVYTQITAPVDSKASLGAGDGALDTAFAFDFIGANAQVEHDCDGLLNPDTFGDLDALFGGWSYGAGIVGAMPAANGATGADANLGQILKDYVDSDSTLGSWSTDWEPKLLHSTAYLSVFGVADFLTAEEGSELCFARGGELTDDGNGGFTMAEEPAYVDASTVLAGGAMVGVDSSCLTLSGTSSLDDIFAGTSM